MHVPLRIGDDNSPVAEQLVDLEPQVAFHLPPVGLAHLQPEGELELHGVGGKVGERDAGFGGLQDLFMLLGRLLE